jgi:hypothetical protein
MRKSLLSLTREMLSTVARHSTVGGMEACNVQNLHSSIRLARLRRRSQHIQRPAPSHIDQLAELQRCRERAKNARA